MRRAQSSAGCFFHLRGLPWLLIDVLSFILCNDGDLIWHLPSIIVFTYAVHLLLQQSFFACSLLENLSQSRSFQASILRIVLRTWHFSRWVLNELLVFSCHGKRCARRGLLKMLSISTCMVSDLNSTPCTSLCNAVVSFYVYVGVVPLRSSHDSGKATYRPGTRLAFPIKTWHTAANNKNTAHSWTAANSGEHKEPDSGRGSWLNSSSPAAKYSHDCHSSSCTVPASTVLHACGPPRWCGQSKAEGGSQGTD